MLVGPTPDPRVALDVVIELVGSGPDDESLAYIAAGPVQAVVVDAGPEVIDRIESVAGSNERFRKALAAVTLSNADPEVAQRVKAIRAEPW